MIAVSDAWKDIQQRFLLPETFVEIDCGITDEEAQSVASATGSDEATISGTASVIGDTPALTKYATFEHNLWALDGTRTLLSDETASTAGYVSNIASTGSVTISFPEIRAKAISGITITWSEQFGEYATIFSVAVKNGNATVAETTVTENKSKVSIVHLPAESYDSIVVQVHDWSLPHHRVRIEKIVIGHVLTFGKEDLLGFSHEMDGDLLSGKLPKYSIEFTLDNSDGRWDPNNPTGMAQYFSERQKITVRYGMDIDGTVEWIPAGTFYLSEWYAPPNGLEARFVARDIFEFLLNEKYTPGKGGTLTGITMPSLKEVILDVFASVELPENFEYELSGALLPYYVPEMEAEAEYTCAEMIQMCANMAGCRILYDRAGKLYIDDFARPASGEEILYVIPTALSYAHPEVLLSKPLKSVSVDYGGDSPYVLEVGAMGEVQTVNNPILRDLLYAEDIANAVKYVLQSRKTVSGEYRSDPRLDVYDVVAVQSKYGELSPVVITHLRYDFNGSFRGTYEGKVVSYREV